MKILKQLALLLAFSVAGALLSYLLGLIHVPFPGSLIGMIMLFLFLLFGWLKSEHVQDVGQFFIDNMGIFFVPAAIAILKQLEVISLIWWKILIMIVGAFLISFVATYWAVKMTLFLQAKHQQKKEESHD